MSDFMKSIVQEVMKPNQKPKENPLFGGESRFLYTKSAANTGDDEKQAIRGINRPNHQREKMQKRLGGIGGNPEAKADIPNPNWNSRPKKSPVTPKPKEFVQGSFAKLQTISLVQGKNNVHNQKSFSPPGGINGNEESQLIGQTREGIRAWLFNSLHPNLQESFQRSLKSNSIGVITSTTCSVGQLFLLNEVLRENPAIKYCLTWNKENNHGFILELYEQDSAKLKDAVKTIFQKISQNSYKKIQVYKVHSPSPWLTKKLDLKGQVNGVAALEGVDYYSAILLLDRFLKKSSEMSFGYAVEKNYLLLHGDFDSVSQISAELMKEADRLR